MKLPECIGPTELQNQGHWNITFAGSGAFNVDARPVSGDSGARSIVLGSGAGGGTMYSPSHGFDIRAGYVKLGYKPEANSLLNILGYSSGAAICWEAEAITSSLASVDDNGVGSQASTAWAPTVSEWLLFEVYFNIGASNLTVTIYKDGVQYLTWTGTSSGATNFRYIRILSDRGSKIDDVEVNAITLLYDTGSSFAPVAGDLITDGTTGATARVSAVDGDGTSGRLYLYDWDSTAFGDGNGLSITGSGSGTASVNAPTSDFEDGLEPNSKRIGNTIVKVIVPTSEGTTIGLTPSTGTDNSALVDEIPYSDTDYVYATAASQYDTYNNNSSTQIPSGVEAIKWVGICMRGRTDLAGIDGVNGVLRVGGTDYHGDRRALATSDNYVTPNGWDTCPDGSGAFARTDLTGGEHGVRLVA